MERTITIGETPITFRASALTVSRYRDIFQIDLLSELHMLSGGKEENEHKSALWCMGMFERLAYVMADKSGNPSKTFEEWMESFPLMDLRKALPEIAGLWLDSMNGTSEIKKKQEKPQG